MLLRGYSSMDTWLWKWTWSLLANGYCFVSSTKNYLAYLVHALRPRMIESNKNRNTFHAVSYLELSSDLRAATIFNDFKRFECTRVSLWYAEYDILKNVVR